MVKSDYSQLELFPSAEEHGEERRRHANPFLSYIWNYEKAVLILIGFLVIGIISFCLGVERGKKLKSLTQDYNLDVLVSPQPPETVHQVLKQEVTLNRSTLPPDLKETRKIAKPLLELKSGYTIQVASFKTNSNAQQEVVSLKKKGFQPMILNKGAHIIVCVGNFANKETARTLLTELKKQYRDCYLRRL